MLFLRFPWFLVRLSFSLVPFFWQVAWLYKKNWLAQAVLTTVILAQLVFLATTQPKHVAVSPTQPSALTQAKALGVELNASLLSPFPASELETRRSLLEKALLIQPNHQALHVNQALLELSTDSPDLKAAAFHLKTARQLDPNSPLFKE